MKMKNTQATERRTSALGRGLQRWRNFNGAHADALVRYAHPGVKRD